MGDGFLDAFWPNVAANVIGIGLGVPAGLWVNRRLVEHQDRKEHESGQKRLASALEGLAAALEVNIDLLRYSLEEMRGGKIITGLASNLSAWEVVRAEVLARLPDLGTRLRLARFFEELALFGQHVERAVTFHYTSAGGDWQLQSQRQRELGEPLQPFAVRLIADCAALQGEVTAARTLLPTSSS